MNILKLFWNSLTRTLHVKCPAYLYLEAAGLPKKAIERHLETFGDSLIFAEARLMSAQILILGYHAIRIQQLSEDVKSMRARINELELQNSTKNVLTKRPKTYDPIIKS